MKSIDDLIDDLKVALDYYEIEYPKKDDFILEMEIKSVLGVMNRYRRFKPHDDVLYDEKYEDKIIPLAIAGFLKNGAEGEIYHGENGVIRQYGSSGKYPKEMLADIVPLTKWK